jgi:predicted RNase H-like HicB family nuclease
MVAMTKAKSYVAVYERDSESDAWLVHVKTIPECHTYGRTLRQAEARIREALVLWLDRDPSSLEITAEWPQELVEVATRVSCARREAAESTRAAGATTTRAAKKLDRMGLSRRDTAEVLGISHQRVQQLLDA